jgi:hypothetical protein
MSSVAPPPPDGTIEVSGPAGGTATVRAQGAPSAESLAVALATARSGSSAVLVDLTGVGHFTTEAVAALLPHLREPGNRVIVTASAVVEGKLARLGLAGVVTPATRPST